MSAIISLAIILLTSTIIYFSGKYFAESSSKVGDYLHLPRSVKGVTFDAISSSFPELMIALYSVLFFHRFEVGIGTIAGSALFNLLIIPGVCVLVSPVVFKVSKEIIHRDAMFYIIAVFTLLISLVYFPVWGIMIPLIFIAGYLWYIKVILNHTKKHQLKVKQSKSAKKIVIKKELLILFFNLIVIGITTYFLTEAAINFSEAIGIPVIVIAFTVIAAGTSLPDMTISVFNAKKGDVDDAASNVFGSNIFDIFIGLGLPALLMVIFTGRLEILFNNLEIIFGLLGATILVLYFLAENHTLHKKEAWAMILMYFIFLGYVVSLSL